MVDKNYKELFFSESQEYLKKINKELVKLEKNPSDLETINEIFRLMHTLKGMSATMGYKELADLAHHLEDIFDILRSEKVNLTSQMIDLIFESVDVISTLIEDLKKGASISVDTSLYITKLKEAISKVEKREKEKKLEKETRIISKEQLLRFKNKGKNIFLVEVYLKKDAPLKSARAFIILNHLRVLGEVIKSIPSKEALKEGKVEFPFKVIIATSLKEDFIKSKLLKITDVEDIKIFHYEEKITEKERPSVVQFKKIQSMRIPVERLDKILNLVGELAIAKSRLIQITQDRDYSLLEDSVYLIDRLVSSLQDETLKMRLLPISYILDNFPRIVRDLAKKEGKEVDLEIAGSDIELDRAILDEIGDPLVHLIRNAIDHGIESPSERIKKGKPSRGKISIKVWREKGHVIIEISDDGRGIDFKKVIEKAVEKGLITQEEALKIEPSQILEILTMPGFSTKEKVTDVSGRGVGLDVVKAKLDALGGRIDLETQPGKGSKFQLTLPLTLAIIKAMLVGVGKEVYAIPLMNIKEVIKIPKDNVKLIGANKVITLREEVIPLVNLNEEFGIGFSTERKELSVVIVESRIKRIGLVVDEIIGEQDIVVKPLGAYIKKIKGIAGATILGDGRVALILDVINIK